MADTFLLEIVTPMGLALSQQVEEVTAPGELGEFGVLKLHTEFLTTLVPGKLSYKTGGSSKTDLVVGAGFAEILPEKTTILVDTTIKPEDIDLAEAKTALDKATEALEGVGEEDPDFKGLESARLLAQTQIDIKGGGH